MKAVDALFRSTPIEVGELRSQPGPGAKLKTAAAYDNVNAEDETTARFYQENSQQLQSLSGTH